jgi:hypothetical protein
MLIALLLGVMGTLACIMYLSTSINASVRPANYRAAVRRVLDAQGVDYRDIEVVDGCAPSYQLCRTYAGSVRVLATMTMPGQIECRERWTTCTITVQQAGIRGVPLDDTINPLAARWEALYGQLILRFRGIYRGNQ